MKTSQTAFVYCLLSSWTCTAATAQLAGAPLKHARDRTPNAFGNPNGAPQKTIFTDRRRKARRNLQVNEESMSMSMAADTLPLTEVEFGGFSTEVDLSISMSMQVEEEVDIVTDVAPTLAVEVPATSEPTSSSTSPTANPTEADPADTATSSTASTITAGTEAPKVDDTVSVQTVGGADTTSATPASVTTTSATKAAKEDAKISLVTAEHDLSEARRGKTSKENRAKSTKMSTKTAKTERRIQKRDDMKSRTMRDLQSEESMSMSMSMPSFVWVSDVALSMSMPAAETPETQLSNMLGAIEDSEEALLVDPTASSTTTTATTTSATKAAKEDAKVSLVTAEIDLSQATGGKTSFQAVQSEGKVNRAESTKAAKRERRTQKRDDMKPSTMSDFQLEESMPMSMSMSMAADILTPSDFDSVPYITASGTDTSGTTSFISAERGSKGGKSSKMSKRRARILQ